jgi:hypothetical protein
MLLLPYTLMVQPHGGVISFRRGGIIYKSTKQKINIKSSIEAKLIGASTYLPHTLYIKMFMEAQVYPINKAFSIKIMKAT